MIQFRRAELTRAKYAPAQLQLLGCENFLHLSASQLIGEIQCLVQLKNSVDLASGVYVYSVSVLEPHDLNTEYLPVDLLSEAHQYEAKSGRLTHEALYKLASGSLEEVLTKIFAQAKIVDISLTSCVGGVGEHKIVNLRDVA